MNVGNIDSGRIEAMMAQLKAAATRGVGEAPGAVAPVAGGEAKVNFADALKSTLDKVSDSQSKANALGQAFAMGDDKVSLSDVMVSMQKASIGFQATVQVRNKVVAAYNDIMNMQV